MKGKFKILSALLVSALLLGVASAQPADYNRVDDSGSNVDNTTITHVPNDGGTIYVPENDSEAEFDVKINFDDSHELDKDTDVNVTAKLYDDSGNTYEFDSKSVNPADTNGETDVETTTVTFDATADTLNSSLEFDDDMTYNSTTEYENTATGDIVEVNESTWFSVEEDSIDYTISLILALVPVFIVFLVLQELKGRKRN